jgi:hypothetical protein
MAGGFATGLFPFQMGVLGGKTNHVTGWRKPRGLQDFLASSVGSGQTSR